MPNIAANIIKHKKKRFFKISSYFVHVPYFTFHIEHIISLKHSGSSAISNLAYACPNCNINKGTDVATIMITRLFVFLILERINGKTTLKFNRQASSKLIGEATIKILNFNHPDAIIERKLLLEYGAF